ncbi:hypothetical protein TCAL_04739 [Tigriopus californicus]|uniref:FAD-binding PCMH-type domain-containing protein n=1 Tax=Tigriopus californicus TaxID=6832 RepID=A0A553P1U4_TIGCA|nr:uncharacterized protein LOC131883384 [Tigriopus californicus]TRY71664.1 hypothetical protein TCAL_04739 [Tigriopus californicus]|eukprot:TCALIF_04739-PA protein Name:"Similar to L-galactono-1,4-lactone dehydrogenase, mitochondrial (Brassica oleracea)" AED:0.01 eAED:0.02 QI:0/-1/0/1/-1/1/1/0/506
MALTVTDEICDGKPRLLVNWSKTKRNQVQEYYEPNDRAEIQRIIQINQGRKIRLLGSNMSPNGIGPGSNKGIALSTIRLNQILDLDGNNQLVRVEPGVKIEQLLEFLAKSKLTLHNLPSTNGMTIAGLVQTSCHGTGLHLATLEEALTEIKVINAKGDEVILTEANNGILFHSAKCSLGTFGVIVELTLKCVPSYYLRETLKVMSLPEARSDHEQRIETIKHVKYHHLPYTGHVVVYEYQEISHADYLEQVASSNVPIAPEEQKASLLQMYYDSFKTDLNHSTYCEFVEEYKAKSFADLREALLRKDVLNPDHIKAVNHAELDFWKKSQHSIVDQSNKRLIFECGGRQHVREFAFPIEAPMQELDLVDEILDLIQTQRIPAPVPIEQRWSCGSQSLLSPVYAETNPATSKFSWVGIIMYLTKNEDLNRRISEAFEAYYGQIVETLGAKYQLDEHLAKIGTIEGQNEGFMRYRSNRLSSRLKRFNQQREEFDPQGMFLSEAAAEILQ